MSMSYLTVLLDISFLHKSPVFVSMFLPRTQISAPGVNVDTRRELEGGRLVVGESMAQVSGVLAPSLRCLATAVMQAVSGQPRPIQEGSQALSLHGRQWEHCRLMCISGGAGKMATLVYSNINCFFE